MKILEELKAAQAILGRFDVPPIDMVWDDAFFSVSEREQLAAVLRRIPQLIEVVEILEAYARLGREGVVLDNKYVQRQHFAVDLLSKLTSNATAEEERNER